MGETALTAGPIAFVAELDHLFRAGDLRGCVRLADRDYERVADQLTPVQLGAVRAMIETAHMSLRVSRHVEGEAL